MPATWPPSSTSFLITSPTLPLIPFNRADLEPVIHQLHPKQATGDECIRAAVLQNAPPQLISQVHELFNACVWFYYIPSLWKTAKIVMILNGS